MFRSFKNENFYNINNSIPRYIVNHFTYKMPNSDLIKFRGKLFKQWNSLYRACQFSIQ